MQEDVCGLNFSWMNNVFICVASLSHLCVTDTQRRASQRIKEVCESFVPSVRVVQVTGVTRSFHHHHAVIGQIAQVAEWQFSELGVLVTINDQRRDLEERRDTKTQRDPSDESSLSLSFSLCSEIQTRS